MLRTSSEPLQGCHARSTTRAERSASLDEFVLRFIGDEHADILCATCARFARELTEAEVAGWIGDCTPGLRRAADGSVTIFIPMDPPGDERASNWLPGPDGSFRPIMRTCQPRREILDGDRAPPAVVKAGERTDAAGHERDGGRPVR